MGPLYSWQACWSSDPPICRHPVSSAHLPPHNTSPLYRRIAGVLRVEIAAGELKAGSQLPTIAALAQRFQGPR